MYAGVQLGGGSWGQGRFRSLRRGALCAPASGISCGWDGGRRTPHPSRLAPRHLPPAGGKALGAAGSLREILGLCAGAGLVPACLWHALRLVRGKEDPSSVTARAATPSPPVGGRLLGRLEACGRFWASAQGRGLPPPVSGMFCDWYGGRRTPHPSRLAPPHLPPHRGKAFGAAGSRPA